MLCAVYVTYTTSRGKTYRDLIAYNLLQPDAERLARSQEGRGYDRIEIESYHADPFTTQQDWS